MRLDDAKTMVLKSLLCLFKHGSYHRKTVSLTYEVFDISWPLTPKRLILVKYDGMVTKERLKNFLVLFLNFVAARTGTEIMIIWSHVMKIGNFGKFCLWWPLVTSMLITRKMVLVLSLELVKTYRVIFFHLSLRCLVLELAAGNICAPPPPGRARVAQTPGRARVAQTPGRARVAQTPGRARVNRWHRWRHWWQLGSAGWSHAALVLLVLGETPAEKSK